jgi:GNAT superfamily N-acetyltransferase
MPESSPVEIRCPAMTEWAACRMLLPEVFQQGPAPEALLAFDRQARQVAGAAAFRYGSREMQGVRLHVVRGHRRRGVGTRLVQRLCELAAARGLDRICGSANLQEEPEAEAFLLANGFRPATRLYSAQGDLLVLGERLRALRDHLVRAGKIPAAARLVEIEEAPRAQLAQMYADHIAATRDFHPGYILPFIHDKRLAGSSVLLIHGAVQGMLLSELNDGANVATVHAKVVAPGYRGGWANCLLMLRSLELMLKAGSRQVRFDFREDNSDTLKLMTRANGKITRILTGFVRDLRRAEVPAHELEA